MVFKNGGLLYSSAEELVLETLRVQHKLLTERISKVHNLMIFFPYYVIVCSFV